jgi:hypothetical protein
VRFAGCIRCYFEIVFLLAVNSRRPEIILYFSEICLKLAVGNNSQVSAGITASNAGCYDENCQPDFAHGIRH